MANILVTGDQDEYEHLLEALVKRGGKVRVLVTNSLFRSEGLKLIYGDLLDVGSLYKSFPWR